MRFWKYRDREEIIDRRDRDEVVDVDGQVHRVGPTENEVLAAYDKGRRDERGSRRSHPFITLLVVALAIVGAVMLYFTIRRGSLSGGGQALEQQIAVAKSEAPGVIHEAGQQVGQAARKVGDQVSNATDATSDAAPAASQ